MKLSKKEEMKSSRFLRSAARHPLKNRMTFPKALSLLLLCSIISLGLSDVTLVERQGSGEGIIILQQGETLRWQLPGPGIVSYEFEVLNGTDGCLCRLVSPPPTLGWDGPIEEPSTRPNPVFTQQPVVDVFVLAQSDLATYQSATVQQQIKLRQTKLRTSYARLDDYLIAGPAQFWDYPGTWHVIVDNDFAWTFTNGAAPPVGSTVTIRYRVEFRTGTGIADNVHVLPLPSACGTVTLRGDQRPKWYYPLAVTPVDSRAYLRFWTDASSPYLKPEYVAAPFEMYVVQQTTFDGLAAGGDMIQYAPTLQPLENGELKITSELYAQTMSGGSFYVLLFATSDVQVNVHYRIDIENHVCGEPISFGCAAGTDGCTCRADGAVDSRGLALPRCNVDLACNTTLGLCEPCLGGTPECGCTEGNTCVDGAVCSPSVVDGALVADERVCEACQAGTLGCVCGTDDDCGGNAICQQSGQAARCVECPGGELGCPCLGQQPSCRADLYERCNMLTNLCAIDTPARAALTTTNVPTTAADATAASEASGTATDNVTPPVSGTAATTPISATTTASATGGATTPTVEETKTPPRTTTSADAVVTGGENPGDGGGLEPYWYAVIGVGALLLLCCLAFVVWRVKRGGDDTDSSASDAERGNGAAAQTPTPDTPQYSSQASSEHGTASSVAASTAPSTIEDGEGYGTLSLKKKKSSRRRDKGGGEGYGDLELKTNYASVPPNTQSGQYQQAPSGLRKGARESAEQYALAPEAPAFLNADDSDSDSDSNSSDGAVPPHGGIHTTMDEKDRALYLEKQRAAKKSKQYADYAEAPKAAKSKSKRKQKAPLSQDYVTPPAPAKQMEVNYPTYSPTPGMVKRGGSKRKAKKNARKEVADEVEIDFDDEIRVAVSRTNSEVLFRADEEPAAEPDLSNYGMGPPPKRSKSKRKGAAAKEIDAAQYGEMPPPKEAADAQYGEMPPPKAGYGDCDSESDSDDAHARGPVEAAPMDYVVMPEKPAGLGRKKKKSRANLIDDSQYGVNPAPKESAAPMDYVVMPQAPRSLRKKKSRGLKKSEEIVIDEDDMLVVDVDSESEAADPVEADGGAKKKKVVKKKAKKKV